MTAFFLETLASWGVRTVFGYPGLLGAMNRANSKVKFVQVGH
ncbi:MAG: hypothetical protein WAL10_20795 [Acetobacteraceae bacterium]